MTQQPKHYLFYSVRSGVVIIKVSIPFECRKQNSADDGGEYEEIST